MKMNVISKAMVALLVVYGSCSAGSLINAAGNMTTTAVRGAQRVQNRLTGTGTMQQRERIVQTPVGKRDMSGETMYAQPYEEVTDGKMYALPYEENGGTVKALPVDEPVDTRRPGMMYAS